jgi:hypothetical protein
VRLIRDEHKKYVSKMAKIPPAPADWKVPTRTRNLFLDLVEMGVVGPEVILEGKITARFQRLDPAQKAEELRRAVDEAKRELETAKKNRRFGNWIRLKTVETLRWVGSFKGVSIFNANTVDSLFYYIQGPSKGPTIFGIKE